MSVLAETDPIELEKGDEAPADGVWLPEGQALFLLAETERLLNIETAMLEALEGYDDNFNRVADLSESGTEKLETAYTKLETCQRDKADAHTDGDMLMSAGLGAGIGVVIGVVVTAIAFGGSR